MKVKESIYKAEKSVLLLCDALYVSMKRDASSLKEQLIYETLQTVLQLLKDIVRPEFSVNVCGQKWKFYTALSSYCFLTAEEYNISGARMVQAFIRAYVSYHSIKYVS